MKVMFVLLMLLSGFAVLFFAANLRPLLALGNILFFIMAAIGFSAQK